MLMSGGFRTDGRTDEVTLSHTPRRTYALAYGQNVVGMNARRYVILLIY